MKEISNMDDNITQEEKESVLFKEPLCKNCQVKYLAENKNVVYKIYSKENAADFLYANNYINVISPFKHYFAQCDSDGNPIKIDGKHVYPNSVMFKNYVDSFVRERGNYEYIFRNLMLLEAHMNAIISNEILLYYNITSFDKFESFISDLKSNISTSSDNEKAKSHMIDEVDTFPHKLVRYKNIYVFMDRLSFSELITIYKMCDSTLKNKIFIEFKNRKYTFGYNSVGAFDFFLKHVVQIRNCICHSNSLEILINYYRVESNEYRSIQSKKAFLKIISILKNYRGAL